MFGGYQAPKIDERAITRVRPGTIGLEGALLVEGFSQCGVEFHVATLLGLDWPTKPHLATWNAQHPEQLAQIIADNNFQLIVLANPTGSWERQLGKEQYRRVRRQLDTLDAALKAAVEDRGATLVLFCAEMVKDIYGGLFGKDGWKEGCYVRTTCYRTPAAAAAGLPAAAPGAINAKSIHLTGVPQEERWYSTSEASANNSLLPRPDLVPGLASVAAGTAGAGRIVFMGDVNAERDSCEVVVQLARALVGRGRRRGRRAPPAAGAATSAPAAGPAPAAARVVPRQHAEAPQARAGVAQPQQAGGSRSSGGIIPPPAERICGGCGANGELKRLLRCSSCRKAWYCSVACQRDDWVDHKEGCH